MAKQGRTDAVSYVRVSGLGQADGDGPERQRQAIAKFARRAGINVVEEFTDLGVSGTKELKHRPGLAKLFASLARNGATVVLIENADRLARDLMKSETIISQLAKAGARVLTSGGVDLSNDPTDPTRKLIRQVLSAVSEFEKDGIHLKLKMARDRAAERLGHRPEGRKPYGTRPNEQALLRRLKQLRRKPSGARRPSFAQVAATLNAEGHRNRAGREWTAKTLHDVWHIDVAQRHQRMLARLAARRQTASAMTSKGTR